MKDRQKKKERCDTTELLRDSKIENGKTAQRQQRQQQRGKEAARLAPSPYPYQAVAGRSQQSQTAFQTNRLHAPNSVSVQQLRWNEHLLEIKINIKIESTYRERRKGRPSAH